MKDINKVILVGRLGGDPVQKETRSGIPVVSFSLATSRRVKGQEAGSPVEDGQGMGERSAESSQEFQEETQWHRVISWGRQGEACAQYLKKGQPVYVEGFFRSRNYSGKDGTARTSFEVHAEKVSFLGGHSGGRKKSEFEDAVATG